MLSPKLITAAAAKPVDLATFKGHLRVDFTDDDTELQAFLDTAVAHLDGWNGILGRCMVNQTWRFSFRRFERVIVLPMPDLQSVTVKYLDADKAEQTVAGANYEIHDTAKGAAIRFSDAFAFPSVASDSGAPVWLDGVFGYGTNASDVPAPLRHAISLLAADAYENREGSIIAAQARVIPFGVDRMIAPYRWGLVAG